MAREFFKNLPNTTTPLTAPRLNALLDGDEAMGNIVVDSIKSKNLFNQNTLLIADGWIYSNGYFTGASRPIYDLYNNTISFYDNFKSNTQYTISCKGYVDTSNANLRIKITYSDSTTTISSYFPVNTEGTISLTSSANKTIKKITFDYSNQTNVFIKDVQLEEGTTATDFNKYLGLGYISGTKTTGNYTIYDDGRLETEQIVSTTQTIDTAWGSLYRGTAINIPNFPITYKEKPTIVCGLDGTGNGFLGNNGSVSTATKAGSVFICRGTTLSSGTFDISVIAKGRWK